MQLGIYYLNYLTSRMYGILKDICLMHFNVYILHKAESI